MTEPLSARAAEEALTLLRSFEAPTHQPSSLPYRFSIYFSSHVLRTLLPALAWCLGVGVDGQSTSLPDSTVPINYRYS